jgi:hypothetical protein
MRVSPFNKKERRFIVPIEDYPVYKKRRAIKKTVPMFVRLFPRRLEVPRHDRLKKVQP